MLLWYGHVKQSRCLRLCLLFWCFQCISSHVMGFFFFFFWQIWRWAFGIAIECCSCVSWCFLHTSKFLPNFPKKMAATICGILSALSFVFPSWKIVILLDMAIIFLVISAGLINLTCFIWDMFGFKHSCECSCGKWVRFLSGL